MTLPAHPRTVLLLGIPFHDLTLEETLEAVDRQIASRRPSYFATANLDFAFQASRDVELQRILLEAKLVLCDGTPLVWTSRWLGAPLRERVAGSDMLPHLLAHAAARGYRVFLLGSTPDVLAEAAARSRLRHPKLDLCGTYAPPFAHVLEIDHPEIVRKIAAAGPDILLVAMGCPKQEKWLYMNYPDLGVPVCLGVGAALDFLAGKFRRAPVWMRRTGTEWIFRLLQEPARLVSRYWLDLLFFLPTLAREWRLRRRHPVRHEAFTTATGAAWPGCLCFAWHGTVDDAAVASGRMGAPWPDAAQPNVVLDCSPLEDLDSAGLGLLVNLFRACKEHQGGLALLRPGPRVREILAATRLDRMIPVTATLDAALALLPLRGREKMKFFHDTHEACLNVIGLREITAATAAEYLREMSAQWTATPQARRLRFDFRHVDFIDSSGLGMLLNLLKLVRQRPGASFTAANVSPNVANVIRVANLQAVLGLEN